MDLFCEFCGKKLPPPSDDHSAECRSDPDRVTLCSTECLLEYAKGRDDMQVIEMELKPATTWPPQDPNNPTQFSAGFEVTEDGRVVPDEEPTDD